MKTLNYLLLSFLFISFLSNSQNLVPNGGFEDYTNLPYNWNESYKATGWSNANSTYSGNAGSPDYLHALGFMPPSTGVIQPNNGLGQMGLITYAPGLNNYREYISIQLNSSLIIGQEYQLTFYLTNGLNGSYNGSYNGRVDNFGVHFSELPITQIGNGFIPVSPQLVIPGIIDISNYWQPYTFSFIATESSNYITFGNFKNDFNTAFLGSFSAYYFIDDIELIILPLTIQGNSSICLGDSTILTALNGPVTFWADSLNPSFVLSTDTTFTVSPNVTTTYFLYSLSDTASFTVNVNLPPIVNLGNDTTLCEGESIILDVANANATYLWQDNSIDSIFNVTQSGTYWVEATLNSCIKSDTIIVNYNPFPIVDLGADTVLCQGEILKLDATIPNATYLWQNNSTNSILNVTQQGVYWLEVTLENCSASDTILVNYKPKPTIDLGLDGEICTNDTLVLVATTPNATYLWQDYSTSSIFQVTQPGEYWVEVTLNECSVIDYITYLLKCEANLDIPNVFTPNGDGINDYFVHVKSDGIMSMHTIIVNRWGNVVFETDDLLINWDGQNVNDGTYFWILEYVDLNGALNKLHGFVNVMK